MTIIGDPGPRRRYTDKPWIRVGRDLVPLLAIGIAFWSVTINGEKADRAEVRAVQARADAFDKAAVNIARLDRLEKKDRDTSRASAFRICSRAMVDRAFAHARVRTEGGVPAVKQLQRKSGLPILDCAPNLVGQPAKLYSRAKQRDYVRRWEAGNLTPVELGICRQAIGTPPEELRDDC